MSEAPTETPQHRSQLTHNGFRRTLTGFDEIFIEKAWGKSWEMLTKETPSTYLRALISVDFKRQGDGDPKHSALSLTSGEVETYFVPEKPQAVDEPGEASSPQPGTSPAGA